MTKKKREIILVLILLAAASAGFLVNQAMHRQPAARVEITVDGHLVQTLDLNQDADLIIDGANGGTNHLIIQNGAAWVSESGQSRHERRTDRLFAKSYDCQDRSSGIIKNQKQARTGKSAAADFRSFLLSYIFYYRYAFRTSTLSSFSHGRSRSVRPKWPYAAVCL